MFGPWLFGLGRGYSRDQEGKQHMCCCVVVLFCCFVSCVFFCFLPFCPGLFWLLVPGVLACSPNPWGGLSRGLGRKVPVLGAESPRAWGGKSPCLGRKVPVLGASAPASGTPCFTSPRAWGVRPGLRDTVFYESPCLGRPPRPPGHRVLLGFVHGVRMHVVKTQ